LKYSAFDQDDIKAMSTALDEVCNELQINGDATVREVVAIRIIELAKRGERSPSKLRQRVLGEATGDIQSVG
jgi:hypothetical protein